MAPDAMAVAEKEIVDEQQLKEKIVNEEYKIWKKLVPLLYDTIRTTALDSPLLGFQWLLRYEWSDDKNTVRLRYLYGTNTSEKSPNYLRLGEIEVPLTLAPDFAEKNPRAELVPIPLSQLDVKLPFSAVSQWKVGRELNLIVVAPEEKHAVCFDGEGIIHLFNLDTWDQTDFKYHKLEGLALAWVGNDRFLLGALDFHVALWDTLKPLTPIQLFKSHLGPINGVSSNNQKPELFCSVLDDLTVQWHDLRDKLGASNPAIRIETAHVQNSVACHPDIATLYATGGRDNLVSLYDIRNPLVPFRELYGHTDSVIGVKWDVHHDPELVVSWSLDKRVIRWHLDALDQEFAPPSEDAPGPRRGKQAQKVDPCLGFIHAGHTNRVNAVDIHPKIPGIYATVGEDSLLEVWKPKTIDRNESDEE